MSLNYNIPLYLSDYLISPDTLGGLNYRANFADVLAAMAGHIQNGHEAISAANTQIFPGPGAQSMYISRGKSYLPGAYLSVIAGTGPLLPVTTGQIPIYILIKIISYNPATGLLWFECQFTSVLYDVLMGQFTLVPFVPLVQPSSNAVTQGVTAGNNYAQARNGLATGLLSNYGQVLFDDFIGRPKALGITAGRATSVYDAAKYPNATTDKNHPGIVSPGNTANGLSNYFAFNNLLLFDLMDFSGVNDVFECSFILTTLSSATRYIFDVGFISSITAAGPVCYLRYSDNLNTGHFQVISGAQNAVATFNSAVTVLVSTWYKVRITRSGTNILVTVNGTLMATIAGAYFSGLGSVRSSPGVRYTNVAGASGYWQGIDYLYVRKNFTGPR